MRKKQINKKKINTEKKESIVRTYPYDSLVDSKRYSEHQWAIRTALDKNRRYTLEEADKAYYSFLKKGVN